MTASDSRPAEGLDPAWIEALRAIFTYDVLHIRQKLLTISQKYYLTDEWDRPRFFVVRPPRLAINLLISLVIAGVRLAILVGVLRYLFAGGGLPQGIAVLIVTNFVLAFVHVLSAPYRHIEVYPDETQSWRLMTITQDNKLGLWLRYTIYDCLGNEVARLRRSVLRSLYRRQWRAETTAGELILLVREDSLWLALLRRYLGSLWGALRTNFDFVFPDGTVIGKYDRKLTITDQYVLDLRGDPHRQADRRVTLAMSILLDTAESR